MTNKLKYHKNYTEFGEPYQLVLPLSLEGLVPDNDSVRLTKHLLFQKDGNILSSGYKFHVAIGRTESARPQYHRPFPYGISCRCELSKETIFPDGTKLEACANRYTFVWKKSVGKWEGKMFGKIQDAVRTIPFL